MYKDHIICRGCNEKLRPKSKEPEHGTAKAREVLSIFTLIHERVAKWILVIIIISLVFFFCLFFRIVYSTENYDFEIVAKKYPTFSNSFVNITDLIKHSNEARAELYEGGLLAVLFLDEDILRKHGIDPILFYELSEKGLIVPSKEK
ncbi:MAG: hypothetical protein ISS77_02260 [Phycisphaerae bacterium]|nr:hypothetical protein [Phycisphaerae bacterium]